MIVNIQRLYYWPKIQPCPWASHKSLTNKPIFYCVSVSASWSSLQHIQWHHHRGDRNSQAEQDTAPSHRIHTCDPSTPLLQGAPVPMGWLKLPCHLRQAQITALFRWQLPALPWKHRITIKYSTTAEAGTSFTTTVLTDKQINSMALRTLPTLPNPEIVLMHRLMSNSYSLSTSGIHSTLGVYFCHAYCIYCS